MLVLSRKKNESIVINNDITIVVVEIRGDKVRLGVEAPREVPVHRREVYEAIQRNQRDDVEVESTENESEEEEENEDNNDNDYNDDNDNNNEEKYILYQIN